MMMNRKFLTACAATLFAAIPMLGGCDREISHEKRVTDSPGKTTVEEKKTVEKPDGSVETTREKKTIDK